MPPLIAEIRMFPFSEPPAGWVPCDGRTLSIDEHQPLFSIVGWRFGGDARSEFVVPTSDLSAPPAPPVPLACIATDGIYPLYRFGKMDTLYVGEIRLFAGTFAPLGWETCDGRALAISEYPALYAVIGTTYGSGPGTFSLPDLRSQVVSRGDIHVIIATSGATPVIPPHHAHEPLAPNLPRDGASI